VLTATVTGIARLVVFADPGLFGWFDLPQTNPPRPAAHDDDRQTEHLPRRGCAPWPVTWLCPGDQVLEEPPLAQSTGYKARVQDLAEAVHLSDSSAQINHSGAPFTDSPQIPITCITAATCARGPGQRPSLSVIRS
jgi:hypothetical protein